MGYALAQSNHPYYYLTVPKAITQGKFMIKDMLYKEKLVLLQDWLPEIINVIKKDLRKEHLQQDPAFVKKFLSNKNLNKLAVEDLVQAYRQALIEEERSEAIADFISNQWLLKNSEVYQYFEEFLRPRVPNFTDISELDEGISIELMNGSINEFGAKTTYFFAVINSVVFPLTIFDQLRQRAKTETVQQLDQEKVQQERDTSLNLEKSYQQQIARLTDKYEKKLQGLQTKYTQDVESLKKQISNLQRKLHAQK